MSTWNDDQLDKLSDRTDAGFREVKGEIKDLRKEMHDGFEKVDQKFEKVDGEFKSVRQEMKEGFAQTATREEMNERFNAVDKRLGDLIRWIQVLTAIGGTALVGNGLFG